MNYKYLFFVVVVMTAMWSCTNAKEAALKDVMTIHDAVMPKTAEVQRLKAQVKKYKDSTADIALKDTLIKTYLLLSQADDGMMDWMNEFREPNDISEAEAVTYLEGEKIKIQAVSDNILSSITMANTLLQNVPDSIKQGK